MTNEQNAGQYVTKCRLFRQDGHHGEEQWKANKSHDLKPLAGAIESEEWRLEKKQAANQENKQWQYAVSDLGPAAGFFYVHPIYTLGPTLCLFGLSQLA